MSKQNLKQPKIVISLEGMQFHAPHGFYESERITKNYFIVDVHIVIVNAVKDDEISHTINYELVYQVVKEVMNTPVKLLETLCQKIVNGILSFTDDSIERIDVKVCKLQPPLAGRVEKVCVQFQFQPNKNEQRT